MADFSAGSIDATLTVDRDPFTEGLERAKEQAEDFEDAGIHIRVDLDDGDALVGFDDIELRADELDGRDINLHVEVDGAAEAEAEMDGLKRSAAGEDGKGGLTGALSALGLAGQLVKPALIGIGIASLPALLGAAGGAALGLGGAFGVALAGLAPFGLLAKADFTDMQASLTDLTKQQQALNDATTDAQREAALKGIAKDTAALQGPAGQAAKAFQNMQSALSDLKKQTAPAVFGVLTQFFNLASDVLPKLDPLINGVGSVLSESLGNVAVDIAKPGFQQFLNWLTPEAQGVIGSLSFGALSFFQGIGQALERSTPLISIFLGAFDALGNRFADFTTSPEFTKLVNYMVENLPLVFGLLGKVGGALGDILKGLSPAAGPALGFIGTLVDGIDKLATGGTLGDLAKIFDSLTTALTPLVPQFATLVNGVLNDLTPILLDIIPPLGKFFGILVGLPPGVVIGLAGAFALLATALWADDAAAAANPLVLLLYAIVAVAAILTIGIYELTQHWSEFTDFLSGKWGTAISVALAVFVPWLGYPLLIIGHWDTLVSFFEGLPGKFERWGKDIWSTFVSAMTTAWGGVERFFKAIPGKIVAFLALLPGALEQAAEYAIAGFILGFVYAAIGVWEFFTVLGPKIISYFNKAQTWLLNAGEDTVKGMWNGLVAASDAVWTFFGNLPGNIKKYGADAISWLLQAGKDTMAGLLNGLLAAWKDVTNWITGAPDSIKGYFSDAKNLLWDAGKAIMEGLLGGLQAGWNDVKGFVGGIAGKISSLKGPLDYDRTLLIPHGSAIMAGLNEGLTTGFAQVQKNVSGFGKQLTTDIGMTGNVTLTGNAAQLANATTQVAVLSQVATHLATLVNVTKDVPAQTGTEVAGQLKPVLNQQTTQQHMFAQQRARQGAAGVSASGS